MKKIVISDKKTGILIVSYEVYDKKVYDKLLKNLKKNKKINIQEVWHEEWF